MACVVGLGHFAEVLFESSLNIVLKDRPEELLCDSSANNGARLGFFYREQIWSSGSLITDCIFVGGVEVKWSSFGFLFLAKKS